MWQRAVNSLQERVASLFYSHGLFCASHPFAIISLVITIILITSYPLTTLPLPGNAPLQYSTPVQGYNVPSSPMTAPPVTEGESLDKRPRWYVGPPVAYVMQFVVKTTVSPWKYKKMISTDAFRGPLSKVFEIIQHINNFQLRNGESAVTQSDVCLHVYETVSQRRVKGLLPEYNCLMVSPANFWGQDKTRFQADPKIEKTITKRFGQPLGAPPLLKDILFGIPWRDTGISRFLLRSRQRVISYSVTVLFKKYNQKYVAALRDHLQELYPLRLLANSSYGNNLAHIYFKDFNYFVEYTPLLVAYFVLFLYLYFSVRKIEMVKSKWGLALSAVVTVVSSLLMSVGICALFGLTPSLKGSEIFPYLVVIIGLENVLVVTKSVVSTSAVLDVKLRVAKGLSKEGWFIFKNLLAELLILAVGFFTFVPAIQEFCLFAVVGLLSDFFLQMFFFTTVLSIDIRRMELSDLQKPGLRHPSGEADGRYAACPPSTVVKGIPQWASHDISMPLSKFPSSRYGRTVHADMQLSPSSSRSSRRVRLMYGLASNRFMQRGIMLCVVMWIALVVYKTGLVEHFAQVALNASEDAQGARSHGDSVFHHQMGHYPEDQQDPHYVQSLLTHTNLEHWNELSHMHWPTLLSYYNITMLGRYITILPSVHLSMVVTPEEAINLRHKDEEYPGRDDDTLPDPKPTNHDPKVPPDLATLPKPLNLTIVFERFFRKPETQTELVMTILLGIASFILFTYCFTALYKCMCSRNYPKWRAKLDKWKRVREPKMPYFKAIRDAVPLVLDSHIQEVECLVTDGPLVVSVCLGGQICVWDSTSAELLTRIERKGDPPYEMRSPAAGCNMNDSDQDLYSSTEHHDHSPVTHSRPIPSPKVCPGTEATVTSHSPCGSYSQTPPGASFNTPPRLSPLPPQERAPPKYLQHARHKSADLTHFRKLSGDYPAQPIMNFKETLPDFTGIIDTDFTSRAAELNSWPPLRHNSVESVASCESMSSVSQPQTPLTSHTSDSQSVAAMSTNSTENKAFDFSVFDKYYVEHQEMLKEQNAYLARRQMVDQVATEIQEEDSTGWTRTRSWSHGDSPDTLGQDVALYERDFHETLAPAVWCMTCLDSLIVAGCGNGRIEFWDGLTGVLKCIYRDSPIGVTAVCFVANKVIAARLNGVLDFLELESFVSVSCPSPPGSGALSFAYNRGGAAPVRRSTSHGFGADLKSWDDIIHIKMIDRVCAHQQPINGLKTEGGRVVTASQDHTLKVFRVEDSLRLYTLHGHSGGVSALFLDKMSPLAAASGSEDGTVRLWDLMTGACVHKLQGHTSTVTSLTCTDLYVISVGMDDQLCIWERCNGSLLHWIHMEPGYCNTVAMLTSNRMVTGGQGCLYLWDAAKGEVLRDVSLGDSDRSVFVRQIQVIGNSTVVCDFGNQLRVIHFPAILEKAD